MASSLILKIFANRSVAEVSIRNQNDVSMRLKQNAAEISAEGASPVQAQDSLPKNVNNAELIEGCGDEMDRMCAVMDDYIEETDKIKSLTDISST
jgi:hypothetical protein